MSFKEFVASHTGRHFFDTFREFVSAFKTYVGHLILHNQITAARIQQQAADFQQEVETIGAVDTATPRNMTCMSCREVCFSSTSVLVGWRGAISLLCVACAKEKGVIDDSKTN